MSSRYKLEQRQNKYCIRDRQYKILVRDEKGNVLEFTSLPEALIACSKYNQKRNK